MNKNDWHKDVKIDNPHMSDKAVRDAQIFKMILQGHSLSHVGAVYDITDSRVQQVFAKYSRKFRAKLDRSSLKAHFDEIFPSDKYPDVWYKDSDGQSQYLALSSLKIKHYRAEADKVLALYERLMAEIPS